MNIQLESGVEIAGVIIIMRRNSALQIIGMGLFSRDKERERYYLLPGMGGKASRRKHMASLLWAMAAGLVVSATLAATLYWLSTRGPS